MASDSDPSSRGFWIGLALGLPVIAFGVRGLFTHPDLAPPAEIGRFLLGGAVVHDAIVLPLVCAVGVIARRMVGPRAWPAVRWGLTTTGIVLLVSRPFVGRYGYRPTNPTAISRDYGSDVIVVISLVCLTAAVVAGVGCLRRRL